TSKIRICGLVASALLRRGARLVRAKCFFGTKPRSIYFQLQIQIARKFSGNLKVSPLAASRVKLVAVAGQSGALLHWTGALRKEPRMAKYGGVDFIDFDSQLNDEERLVRQT